MAKLFVFSDIHGYFDIFYKALMDAGYDSHNPEHWLIGLGDYFDRGHQPEEVMQFLMAQPRKILIRGNHEDLFEDMCDRAIPAPHDYANGTFETAQSLMHSYYPSLFAAEEKVSPFFRKMINYFETKNYIFVHSFIPTFRSPKDAPIHWTTDITYTFNPDWRYAHNSEWKTARWGNPFELSDKFAANLDKTIIFGHWHTYSRRKQDDPHAFDIYYGDNYIGIDACTATSGQVNILVLEDDFVEED